MSCSDIVYTKHATLCKCGSRPNLFGYKDRTICACPNCQATYIQYFCRGEFPRDGYNNIEDAVTAWNIFHKKQNNA